jgi:hypothetical protein
MHEVKLVVHFAFAAVELVEHVALQVGSIGFFLQPFVQVALSVVTFKLHDSFFDTQLEAQVTPLPAAKQFAKSEMNCAVQSTIAALNLHCFFASVACLMQAFVALLNVGAPEELDGRVVEVVDVVVVVDDVDFALATAPKSSAVPRIVMPILTVHRFIWFFLLLP